VLRADPARGRGGHAHRPAGDPKGGRAGQGSAHGRLWDDRAAGVQMDSAHGHGSPDDDARGRGPDHRRDAMKRLTAFVAAILLLAACSGHNAPVVGPSAGPLSLSWQEVKLPAPPGPAGRLAVRDAQACDGKWYVVGAVLGAVEDPATVASRPAAWTSDDGRTWRAMT